MSWLGRGLVDLALTGYAWAAIQAYLDLTRRGSGWPVPTRAIVVTAWGFQTLGLVLRAVAFGRPPVGGMHDLLSAVCWVAILLLLWAERRYALRPLGAFVLPPVAVLGLVAAATPEAALFRAAAGPGLWIHALAAVLAFGALAGNFAGGLMYVIQEQSLKHGRIIGISNRLPPLDVLDRFAFHALIAGFPFLTLAIVLGTISAGLIHGMGWLWQPTPVMASVTWGLYATALYLRGTGGWGGRRAAYLFVAGFVALVATLGIGLVLPTRHVVM